MSGLTAAATLDLWERVEQLPPVERAVALAAAVEPRDDASVIARLPLGRRDERLLRLRAALAGGSLDATAACPACGERVEFAADGAALVAMAAAARDAAGSPLPVELDGYRVSWRPPDSDDMAAAAMAVALGSDDMAAAAGAVETGSAAADSVEAAERFLVERCVESAVGPDGMVAARDLPAGVREALSAAMAEADPLAEVVIGLTCPVCREPFDADLDVAGFVWTELRDRARRVLRDVAVLARAFGWTEGQVLALPEKRRAAYLALVREGVA